MAAHLARHANTIHATGKGRKRSVRLGKKRKAGRRGRPARRSATVARSARSDGALRLLDGMRAYYTKLVAQRDTLDVQISGIETAMSAMGGAGARAGAARGRRPTAKRKRAVAKKRGRSARAKGGRRGLKGVRAGSLKEMIVKVLRQRGRAMSPNDLSAAVRASGYKSKAKDLAKAVSNTLPELNMVRKVGHGMYRA